MEKFIENPDYTTTILLHCLDPPIRELGHVVVCIHDPPAPPEDRIQLRGLALDYFSLALDEVRLTLEMDFLFIFKLT